MKQKSIQPIEVPDAFNFGESRQWDLAYRKWLRKRGFTDELARIEQMSERSRFNAAKKKGSK